MKTSTGGQKAKSYTSNKLLRQQESTCEIVHQILKYFTKHILFHYKRTEISNIT